MQPEPTASPGACDEVARLRKRLDELWSRYGRSEYPEQLLRLQRGVQRRTKRIEALRCQIAQIEEQIRWLDVEIAGFGKGLEMLLGDAIRRIERDHAEAWSPVPVLGYRIWKVAGGGLHGVQVRWNGPVLDAVCRVTFDDDEIPHTDGRCGRLGCGVYAAKDVHELLQEFVAGKSCSFAAGVVAMTGKVVEHERGYRAAHARVIALAVARPANVVFADDPDVIAAIFDDPAVLQSSNVRRATWTEVHDRIAKYLSHQAWRNEWTSAGKNE
ncbi:hypothetical protein BMS3Abin02_01214 [bacterium BMS3Abin02]|nr:hypothetical protein BMS3Abin02_01214 [bacterium BMS3Abin02]